MTDATDPPGLDAWKALASKDLKGRDPDALTRTRPEGIDVKPLYTAADVESLDTDTLPGLAPFTRGVRATMYANRPWTIRQYAGF
ncbi:MAG TPA: methylmalonyl-CoA mutase family protein, partial [Acidimicrobiales bacterium]|nr:methylmalonyl-CoA mutase family protein [Acidimicrobiales bacterium]